MDFEINEAVVQAQTKFCLQDQDPSIFLVLLHISK